jgi:gamma-glutamylcyclotransferase (GGCT)/AIG2-like uncharacterized protein YtfP
LAQDAIEGATMDSCNSVFAYGTLQRGEVRGEMWPRPPRSVQPATVRGRLHDLGPYPALVQGNDLIRGELWTFESGDMPDTLATLDAIEGHENLGSDLFCRRTIACRTQDGLTRMAYVYFYAQPGRIAHRPIVRPDAHGYCQWRKQSTADETDS